MNNFLKAAISIAVIITSGSIAYYFLYSLPHAQKEQAQAQQLKELKERRLECERNNTEAKAAAARATTLAGQYFVPKDCSEQD